MSRALAEYHVAGVRTNGMTYGWNINHADVARDRNKNANQLVDTLVHMRAGSSWSINLPNGTYDVRLHFAERASGNDAIGKRVFSISAEGVTYRSAFDPYRGFKSDETPLDWRAANDLAARIGGWRAYARDAGSDGAGK